MRVLQIHLPVAREPAHILAALAQQRAGAVRDDIAQLVISPPGANAVRAIVQAHGGRIALAKTAQGKTAQGTRIEMEFPWPAS